MKKKHTVSALFTACSLLFCLTGCTSTEALTPMSVLCQEASETREIDDRFSDAQLSLAAELFRNTATKDSGNTLIAPLSVSYALALCANGAAGDTLAEMENVLGLSAAELNGYLSAYTADLPSDNSLCSANSVWFRDSDSLTVRDSFLYTASDSFGAGVFASPFDSSAVREINRWVSKKTDGMIDSIADEIPPSAMLILINALSFNAEWENTYDKYDLYDTTFTAYDGTQQACEMMRSTENTYLTADDASGFIRPYKGGDYSFAAILPDEGTDIFDWIAALTPEKLGNMLSNASKTEVIACLPKFKADTTLVLNDILAQMGMPKAFDMARADFSDMASTNTGDLFISQVLHKTHIEVDTNGTRAAAVTSVMMEAGGAPMPIPEVILNRPFVYMILDRYNIPVFIGVMTDMG